MNNDTPTATNATTPVATDQPSMPTVVPSVPTNAPVNNVPTSTPVPGTDTPEPTVPGAPVTEVKEETATVPAA